MNVDPLENAAPAPASDPRRRDRLPLWVVVLLVLFLAERVYEVGVAPFLPPPAAVKSASVKSPAAAPKEGGGSDTASMGDLLDADVQAKLAFVQSLAKPGTTVKPDPKALREALKAAQDMQRDSGNSPSAARRVILLRALVQTAAPGRDGLPPLAVGKNGLAPLDAFGSALPPDIRPQDRARYADEARLWQTVFGGGALSPRQTAAAADQIRRLPNIRWWRGPALSALYTRQGDLSEANRYGGQARDTALPSLLPFLLLILVRFGFILMGLVLLVYFVVRAVQRRQERAAALTAPLPVGASPRPPSLDLWPTLPVAIPDTRRRLGAGDLMAVFVVYLLTREILGRLMAGFDIPPLLHFRGLIAPFRPAIDRLPASDRTTLGIVLESAAYLLSAVPPTIMLWTLARQRGAALADEIGWTRRRLGQNLVYGLGGFALASALMIPVVLLGRVIFKHAPDPSNPVIPQLIGTSGFWGPFLLVALASLAAPVVEELLFRGVLYPALRMRLGVWPGIVLTGAVFGFVHPVGIAEMLAIGTLGGVFAWMAETRKSLAPSMFAHFLQNFTTTMLLLSVLSG